MARIKTKTEECTSCGAIKQIYARGMCAFCYQKERNEVYAERQKSKPKKAYSIPRVSKKRAVESRQYSKRRKEFLTSNPTCFVEGCNKPANTIEHIRGRQGYADQEAKDKGITLYLDERYWRACCLEHNLEFERNPELSKKYQLSKIHGGEK